MTGNDVAESALRDARDAWRRGDGSLAESRCRDALAADPGIAQAWTLLGVVLHAREPAAAHAALIRALEIDPQDADARFQLGNHHRKQRRFAEAIAAYEAVLADGRAHPAVLNNLGLAVEATGDHERAALVYRSAQAREPGHRQSLGNLVHLLCRQRRYSEALPLADDYVRRFPDAEATIWVDYGMCRHHEHDNDGAEMCFRRALTLAPGDRLILTNLGSVLSERLDFEEAEPLLTQANAQDPPLLYASSLLAFCRAQMCQWEGLAELHGSIAAQLDAGSEEPINAFAALSIPLSSANLQRVSRRWARDLVAHAAHAADAAGSESAPAKRRLGYVSSDLRTYTSMSSLMAEVWERHDRTRLETFAYSIGPPQSSPRIEAAFDHFLECSSQSAEEIAERIRRDRVDVLIDLNGYTTYAKSEIFALRPAPVQVSWLGYLGTLGAPWYDYVLTDRFVCPPSAQRFFDERFLYLPDCYCPSDTRREVADLPSRAECGLPEEGFVYCCFNQSYKILPELFAAWMRLLAAVPGSVLWLAPTTAAAAINLHREAAERGIEPTRLVFAPRRDLPEHLARHVHADLFLDTAPYNAGTTANDALFMGVPVLTCSGETMASRVAGSQLIAIGLPELIATSIQHYEALAMALAREPARLRDLRERLRANRAERPLFDMGRFTSALDDLLCSAWENRTSSRFH